MNLPTNPPPDVVCLRNGTHVSKIFFEDIKHEIRQQLPNLIRGSLYTLKQICSREFWLSLSDGERRLAGACVANMVEKGQLELSANGRDGCNAQRYCLT